MANEPSFARKQIHDIVMLCLSNDSLLKDQSPETHARKYLDIDKKVKAALKGELSSLNSQ